MQKKIGSSPIEQTYKAKWLESSGLFAFQQQRQQICPDQLVVITRLSLLILWEMNPQVSVATKSQTANKLKIIVFFPLIFRVFSQQPVKNGTS